MKDKNTNINASSDLDNISGADVTGENAQSAANADANAKVRSSGASDEHPDIEMAARTKIAMPAMPDNTPINAGNPASDHSYGAYYDVSDESNNTSNNAEPSAPAGSDGGSGGSGNQNSSAVLTRLSDQMRAKDIWLGILSAFLAAALAASFYLGSAFFAAKRDMERRADATGYQIALENQYQEHLYELCEQLNSIESDLLKATISNGATMQQHQLSLVEGYTTASFSGLSALPYDGESRTMDKCIQFANQCNDYCRFLSDELSAEGRILDEAEKANLRSLSRVAGRLSKRLGKIAENGHEFTYDFDGDIPQAVKSMSAIPERTFRHPDIVYDGTYTDAPLKKSVKMVGKKLTAEECKERLLAILRTEGATNAEKVGEIKSDYKAKVYDVSTAKGKYNVIMCEDGRIMELSYVGSGSVVLSGGDEGTDNSGEKKAEQNAQTQAQRQKSASAEGGGSSTNGAGVVPRTAEAGTQNTSSGGKNGVGKGAAKMTDAEYESAAIGAAKRMGYGELTPVELTKPQMGRIFVTLVPSMAGDILVYPRTVVVNLAEEDAQVLGISAQGFLFEEKEREMPKSVQSAEAAEEKLWDKLKMENVRRAVISTGAREYFCYEFECKTGGKTAFVYIDMQTLAEREIKVRQQS